LQAFLWLAAARSISVSAKFPPTMRRLSAAGVFVPLFFVYTSGPMNDNRKIIHIDMDAFYASVEQRDNPALKSKPVIVGGDPQSRGVVAACSYEARTFGIHSAMACATAYKRCPHAVFIRPRFDVYKSVSRLIREIFLEYTDLVEPLSLDEAFLEVTHNKKGISSATQIAQQIRRQIFLKTDGLTASAGV